MSRKKNGKIALAVVLVVFLGTMFVQASESAFLYSNESSKATSMLDMNSLNYVYITGSVGQTSAHDVEFVVRGSLGGYGGWYDLGRFSKTRGQSFSPIKYANSYTHAKATMYGNSEASPEINCIAACTIGATNDPD